MKLIKNFSEKRQERLKNLNLELKIKEEAFINAIKEMNDFLVSENNFLDLMDADQIVEKHKKIFLEGNKKVKKRYRKVQDYREYLKLRRKFLSKYQNFNDEVANHNQKIARYKLSEAYEIVDTVEGRLLDEQQMLCVLKEVHSHLVIAGAGTGKTTTIIGKIKYLLEKGLSNPSDILVLSFTNTSASEMRSRIKQEIGNEVEASTFHKLGLDIIKHYEGISPKITRISLQKFIRHHLKEYLKVTNYSKQFLKYFLYHGVTTKSEFEFKDEVEYLEYLEINPPITINGETVKSYGELDIANFLAENGINYEYEAEYQIDTRTSEHGLYYPDFFLPEYNLYIEYFGINKNGEVPAYFKGKGKKSAVELYHESIDWKRKIHKKYKTSLIETFSYEKFDGNLLINLEEKLNEFGVIFNQVSTKELLEELTAQDDNLLNGFIELSETIINLLKSNDYTISDFKDLINNYKKDKSSNLLILNLIEPFYNDYNDILIRQNEIDFNDMINRATKYVRENKYQHNYKHVLVDEYQDISKARYLLLQALRESKDYNLFCVGDDWQSIYRFAGSDVGFILNFEKYWGVSEISKIETTYRFPQSLIDISSDFIMKNPNQVKKSIIGKTEDHIFPLGIINGYTNNNLVDFLAFRLEDLPYNSSVLFLGRYSSDIEYIKNSKAFSFYFDNRTNNVRVTFQKRLDLRINFLTVHRSKGLQADYIFILNNKKSKMGFPSKIQDATILELLLDNSDDFPLAEERRLFYVALTRAKKKVILLTLENKESQFVKELKENYSSEITREAFTCPLCGGYLIRISGQYGDFFGCSNYRSLGCKYTRSLKTNKS